MFQVSLEESPHCYTIQKTKCFSLSLSLSLLRKWFGLFREKIRWRCRGNCTMHLRHFSAVQFYESLKYLRYFFLINMNINTEILFYFKNFINIFNFFSSVFLSYTYISLYKITQCLSNILFFNKLNYKAYYRIFVIEQILSPNLCLCELYHPTI